MKTKLALLLSVLLLLSALCGCGSQTAPDADTQQTTGSAAAQSRETVQAASDTDETKLYADYLANGGYNEIMGDFFDEEAEYEAEAVLADVNGDGTRELLMHISDVSSSGVMGHSSVSFLLGADNGTVERLGFAYYGGGSGGGDYLLLKYDTVSKTHVLEYEEYVRDGMFCTIYALHFFDFSRRDTEEKAYGLSGAGDVVYKTAHTLRSVQFYSGDGEYADDAQRILDETDLSKQEDGFVSAWQYDDAYISESEYDEMCARFVEPTDPAYQMKPVTMDAPIPD